MVPERERDKNEYQKVQLLWKMDMIKTMSIDFKQNLIRKARSNHKILIHVHVLI